MKQLMFFMILAAFAAGCETIDPPEETPKPAGYQEDIPWPSLADSPWPMYQADPQSSGRSKGSGPSAGIVETIIRDSSGYLVSGAIYGPDSSIYFGQTGWGNRKNAIFGYNLQGSQLFKITNSDDPALTPYVASTPVCLSSNKTVFLTETGSFYFVEKDGNFNVARSSGQTFMYGLTVDMQGRIYYGKDKQTLACINQNGDELFTYKHDDFFINSLSFSPDGKTLYIPGNNASVYAFDIANQSVKWTFGVSQNYWQIVDAEGNIYLVAEDTSGGDKPKLFSLTPGGEVRWFAQVNAFTEISANRFSSLTDPAALDRKGNIYIASDTLYSFSYEGVLNWKKDLGGAANALSVDNQNKIYVAPYIEPYTEGDFQILSFDQKGNLLFRTETLSAGGGWVGPLTIGYKKLIVGNWNAGNNSLLYTIE